MMKKVPAAMPCLLMMRTAWYAAFSSTSFSMRRDMRRLPVSRPSWSCTQPASRISVRISSSSTSARVAVFQVMGEPESRSARQRSMAICRLTVNVSSQNVKAVTP
jgi:hypothetical protein